jgi:magnesium transporter
MARFVKHKISSVGNIPGEPVFLGIKKMDKVDIHIIDFNNKVLNEHKPNDLQEIIPFKDTTSITWININGLHDIDTIQTISDVFSIHPLVVEDIVNTGQRPKIEEYDDYIYIVTKMMKYDSTENRIHTEQLSIILGKHYVITLQECPGDVFDPVRKRIRQMNGRIRHADADYLAYSLLDMVMDNYISIVERMGEKIEDLEEEISQHQGKDVLTKINNYKREMNYFRKTIRPAREFLLQFYHLDSNLILKTTRPFLKDLLDTSIQAVETIDTYRDMLSDHVDYYNSGVNNRLNEIMKVLTIFSAIFIPLTFIAGINGTNFDFLPELHFKYSYPIFWGVLILISTFMLRFFKKKNWL